MLNFSQFETRFSQIRGKFKNLATAKIRAHYNLIRNAKTVKARIGTLRTQHIYIYPVDQKVCYSFLIGLY